MEKFESFLETIVEEQKTFVVELHEFMTMNGCHCDMKTAKSGYVVSYVFDDTKRTLATFVLRKTGVKLRIYPEHLEKYEDFLNELSERIKKDIRKASICKRLLNPTDCNPRCVMGYSFMMDNERYQKCRYMAFMPTLHNESNSYIKSFLMQEIASR